MKPQPWKWSALVFVILSLCAPSLAAQTCEPQPDLAYGTYIDRFGQSQDLLLDLLLPLGGTAPAPVVIYIHGGGWKSGSRAPIPSRVADLCAQGYAVASLDYRLTGTAIWPAQIQDVRGAVRWLRANASTYGLDPDRFAAWGESAGAHLAALLGTSGGVPAITIGNATVDLEGTTGGNLGESSRVQAVVDWYGATDFLQMRFYPTTMNHDAASSDEGRLIGGPIQDHPERTATANPITYVTPDDSPFLVMHGTADKTNPFNQSELLVDALTASGVSAELRPVQGAGHGGTLFNASSAVQAVYAFIDAALLAPGAAAGLSSIESASAAAETDLPVVQIIATDARATEVGGDPGSFTVTRDGLALADLTVTYSVTGTATAGSDYTALSGTVTIPAGSSSIPLPVTPHADDLRETGETVILTLVPAAGYTLGSPATASVVLADVSDPARPTVSVSATDRDASEPGTNQGAFVVSRTGSTAEPLTVQVTVAGTADGITDYVLDPAPVTFAAGVDRVTVRVEPLEDYLMEETESVTLAIVPDPGPDPGIYVGPYAGARVALADDDVPGLPVLLSLTVAPATVTGGASATGTVTLDTAAPAGGAVVSLSPSNPSAATVPASVTVAAGSTSATFTVTSKPVAATTSLFVAASYRGVGRTAPLTVEAPVLSGLTLTPATVAGGCRTSTGKVTLSGKAPTGGLVVTLTNGNPAAAVPASVTVPAGASSATFPIPTTTVTAIQSGTVTASLGGATRSASLTVRPIGLQSLSLAPNPVVGPGSVTGTVTLECDAPAGGIAVALSSTATAVARPDVPGLTIPAGTRTASFPISTADVSSLSSATIRATTNSTSKSVLLTVQP